MSIMPEREFLIRLAIDHWRSVYGDRIDYDDVDIRSFTKNYMYALAYEVFSVRDDDQFRIHMYLNFAPNEGIYHSYLGVTPSQDNGTLEDEQYVLLGNVDNVLHAADGYMWGWLDPDPTRDRLLLLESGFPVSLENGELIALE